MPIVIKAGRDKDKTYYQVTCPECNGIYAFKESETVCKHRYANGVVSSWDFRCPNCECILDANTNDRMTEEAVKEMFAQRQKRGTA